MSNLFELFGIEDTSSSEPVKQCRDCNAIKPITQFSKRSNNCKGCVSISWKKYHAENKEILKEKQKKYNHEKRTPEQREKYFKEKEYRKELPILYERGERRCRICNKLKNLLLFQKIFRGNVFFNLKLIVKNVLMKNGEYLVQKLKSIN
jgi:hypothetical protein